MTTVTAPGTPPTPVILPRDLIRPGTSSELPSLTKSRSKDSTDSDELTEACSEKDSLLPQLRDGYGSLSPKLSVNYSPTPAKRTHDRRQSSRGSTASSYKFLSDDEDSGETHDNEESDEEEDDDDVEEPPDTKIRYRRSRKDVFKLVVLPILYFLLMVLAVVFAFYTIQDLVLSYENRVRSVKVTDVGDRDPFPSGIVIYPEFATFLNCTYRYYDDLSPNAITSPAGKCSSFVLPMSCNYTNITFRAALNYTRHAMVFESQTLVACKESLLLRFMINTTFREFSAIEYQLFYNWNSFFEMNSTDRQQFLVNLEANQTIYTFPSGFRTWVKMSYTVQNNPKTNENTTFFEIIDNYAQFTPFNATYKEIVPMEILFEWDSSQYEYIQEIISTTAWSAFGSLCGVFITLEKAGEFCRAWLRRLRRERQKKIAALQVLEEELKRQNEEYEKRKLERQLERQDARLRRSMEYSKSLAVKSTTT